MIVSFIGHSTLHSPTALTEKVRAAILSSIPPCAKVFFYCGGYGEFDDLCARVCRSLREKSFDCEILFITPYITPAQQKKIKYFTDTKLYDAAIYPPLEHTPLRFAIDKRNRWMIEQADLVICHVTHHHGGAYKAMEYARRKGIKIINLE